MIDMWTVEDGYKSFEINDVALVRAEHNITDLLSKVMND